MAPGQDTPHLTADTERVPEEQTRQTKEWITGQIPLKRFGHPGEIPPRSFIWPPANPRSWWTRSW